MNTITLVGRLTDDPETATANSDKGDKTVTRFRLAVPRPGSDTADYVTIVSWARTAEVAAEHLAKGRLVGIEGRLRHHEWTADDGSRRERHDVTASNIQFLDRPKTDN